VRVYQFRHIRAERQCSPGDDATAALGFTLRMWKRPRIFAVVVVVEVLSLSGLYVGYAALLTAALFSVRSLAWVGVVVITSHLAIQVVGRAALVTNLDAQGRFQPDRRALVAAGVRTAAAAAVVAGVSSAATGSTVGPWIVIIGLCSLLAADVVVGIVGYREVMGRPWPDVAPLEDDNDW
jgi:hypothetical protein